MVSSPPIASAERVEVPQDRATFGPFPATPDAFKLADLLVCDTFELWTAHAADRARLIGLSGAQGSGKTTMARRLVEILGRRGRKALSLSLDDFYLPKKARLRLARTVHPLLAKRGVPGSHDVTLAQEVLDGLCNGSASSRTALPLFDKAADDRLPMVDWPRFRGRADVVIFEGWCLGARAQSHAGLGAAVNELEAREDPELLWRRFVNDQLAHVYPPLFARMDKVAGLRAPAFECVLRWRAQQEQDLKRRSPEGKAIMSRTDLRKFVSLFQRITEQLIDRPTADLVIEQDKDRRPIRAYLQRA